MTSLAYHPNIEPLMNLTSFLNGSNLTMISNDTPADMSCPSASVGDRELLVLLSFLLEGVLQIFFSFFGVLGNAASIFLLSRPGMRSSFNQLLAALASFDLLYLFTMLLEAVSAPGHLTPSQLRRLGLETSLHVYLFPPLLYPLNAIAMTGSIFMTVGVTVERYIAVYHPLYYNKVG